jgi:hypothetical protein
MKWIIGGENGSLCWKRRGWRKCVQKRGENGKTESVLKKGENGKSVEKGGDKLKVDGKCEWEVKEETTESVTEVIFFWCWRQPANFKKKWECWGQSVFKKRDQATCGVEEKWGVRKKERQLKVCEKKRTSSVTLKYFFNAEGNLWTFLKKGECWGQLKVWVEVYFFECRRQPGGFKKKEVSGNGRED